MLNKNNLLRFLIVVLFLSSIAIATETTWRHSGFEISGYDINGSSTYNLTEIRKIEFGWNSTIPLVSETSRAVMYYDDNQKRIMQSLNGGTYQAIVTNATVDFQTGNASNITRGVLPNASIPASAMNVSQTRFVVVSYTRDTTLTGVQALTGAGFRPTYVQIMAAMAGKDSASWGVFDGTTMKNMYQNAGTFYANSPNIIQLFNSSLEVHANAAVFTADGMNITWGGDSPVGTAAMDVTFWR